MLKALWQSWNSFLIRQVACFCFLGGLWGNCPAAEHKPIHPLPQANSAAAPQPVLKYLALGDSYTIGQGVIEGARFPHQTTVLLRKHGFQLHAPDYIAATGWTTQALLEAIAEFAPSPDYDLVTLLIGVNNQYRGLELEEYGNQFRQCLEKAVSLARGQRDRVFVLSIPDYGATPYGRKSEPVAIGRAIDAFNAVNRKIARDFRVSYTDITPGSREARRDLALVAADRLHPSQLEYAKWAALLAPKMVAALRH